VFCALHEAKICSSLLALSYPGDCKLSILQIQFEASGRKFDRLMLWLMQWHMLGCRKDCAQIMRPDRQGSRRRATFYVAVSCEVLHDTPTEPSRRSGCRIIDRIAFSSLLCRRGDRNTICCCRFTQFSVMCREDGRSCYFVQRQVEPAPHATNRYHMFSPLNWAIMLRDHEMSERWLVSAFRHTRLHAQWSFCRS